MGKEVQVSTSFFKDKKLIVWIKGPEDNDLVELCKVLQASSIVIISSESEMENYSSIETDFLLVASEQQSHLLLRWPECPIPILNDFELMQQLYPELHYIALTGSNGKTTTCLGIEHILKAFGYNVLQAGHAADEGLGLFPATACLQLLQEQLSIDFIICEMACHQTQYIKTFRPQTSVFTNFFPIPPTRYESVEEYLSAKKQLLVSTKYTTILNSNNKFLRALASEIETPIIWFGQENMIAKTGVYVVGNDIWLSARGNHRQVASKSDIQLLGQHSLENVLAMITVAQAVAGDFSTLALKHALTTFRGVEHRIEPVKGIAGLNFINDSKSTNIASTLAAIESSNKPMILILGGEEIGTSYAQVANFQDQVLAVLAIGENRARIVEELVDRMPVYEMITLEQAIAWVEHHAPLGTTILFSPGTTSQDQFRNYRERGDMFKQLVHRIKGKPN